MSNYIQIFPTGGTIVGKTTGNGQYIAGALSPDEQAKLIEAHLGKPTKLIGSVNPKGSQNMTDSHIAQIVRKIYLHQASSENNKKGILITTGTDKMLYLTHALSMLLPNPTMPIVITAAMCPPGGAAKGIGSYEDGPVNIKNAHLLLEQLEQSKRPSIVCVMEDKAFHTNVKKDKPKGVENAFKPRYGTEIFTLEEKQEKDFINHAGDKSKLHWNINKENIPTTPKLPQEFSYFINKVLTKMETSTGLPYTVITDLGQNDIDRTILHNARLYNVIGYRGIGNGNINEKDAEGAINNIVMRGKTLIRGTQSEGGEIRNETGEAVNVRIHIPNKLVHKEGYKLTDLTVPQGRFSVEQATKTVAMMNVMGLTPPKKNKDEDIKDYINRYQAYIKDITTALQSTHPLAEAMQIILTNGRTLFFKETKINKKENMLFTNNHPIIFAILSDI